MTDLTGKTALVTGSVQGIGLAIAESLARAGVRIAVHGLAGEAQIEEACARLRKCGSPQAEFFAGNLRNPDRIAELMASVAAWGGADILVNNAGIQHTASLADMPRVAWDSILAIHLSAAFHTMQAALPPMARRGYGRVINIASFHGLVASPEKDAYVAAKHGLIGLTKVAALEYAAAGDPTKGSVTVNCICPGWTETELLAEKQPSRRISEPAEIGALALWLCAPLAHNITGATIPVDGGWTAQ